MRLILSDPAPGAWNMALDEALMDAVREGAEPVLRFYRWQPACLSLGRNQPAAGFYDRDEIARRGLGVVRRPTGGRAVVHARELTYSVIVPDRSLGGPRESYAAINGALVAGLRELGVAATLQAPTEYRAPVPSTNPCFLQPAQGEVVLAGRKLIGSAQLSQRGVLLQHGSLLLQDDQALLRHLERAPRPGREPPPAVLADHCHPLPTWEALTAALVLGWSRTFGAAPRPSDPTGTELALARRYATRHEDLEWIWRR